jgi:hypothetical protein
MKARAEIEVRFPAGAVIFSFSNSVQGVKLRTHLHLLPRSRMVELHLHSPICHHGVVFN